MPSASPQRRPARVSATGAPVEPREAACPEAELPSPPKSLPLDIKTLVPAPSPPPVPRDSADLEDIPYT